MKATFVTLAIFLIALLITPSFAQEELDQTQYEDAGFEAQWLGGRFGYGFPHPHPHPYYFYHPSPKFGHMTPISNDDKIKCFEAYHTKGMLSCIKDIRSLFYTHQMYVSHDCCSALENIAHSCKYESHFLKDIATYHCSGGGSSPSSSSPSPSPSH